MNALPCDPGELARALFDQSAEALFLFDPGTEEVLDVNPAAERLAGVNRAQLLHRKISELVRADGGTRTEAGSGLRCYLFCGLGDDAGFPVHASFTRLAATPTAVGLVRVRDLRRGHDAHQQLRQTEDDLRRSEERYRQLWQRNLAGIVRASLDGRILDCNDAFARLFGYTSREEMFTRSTTELYFDLGVRQEFLERLRERQMLTNYEMQMRRADGTAIWVIENVSLLVEEGEEILEGTLIDISERKRIEEALRGSEANYRTLINHLDQAIFLKDRDLRYVTVNPVFCAGVGMSEEQLRGKTIGELFPDNALTEKSRAIELQVLREGRAIETEDVVKIAGEPRSVRISRTPVKDEAGAVVGVLGICWDVTGQREMEAQLRHVQKMDALGLLAGGIAHDFNNLLTIMLGNLSCVLTQKQDWQASLELLRNAEKAGLRAAELTHTLLGFSRRAALATTPLNLNTAIDEVVRLTRSTLPASVELDVRGQPQLWLVQADAGHMNQILTNLTLNARDALPGGGRITYETSHFIPDADYLATHVEAQAGEFVRLRVRDNGLGIPAGMQRRIFEPFFTTKEKGKGTGLGLAIVFSIVKQHNGWIDCASEPGRGTTFDIFLPRCLAAPASSDAASIPAETSNREIILLVDDEPMIRQLTRTILTKAGFQVLVAEDGVVALEVLDAHADRIALIILDAVMPRLSGRDTLRELTRIAPGIGVLFSSGYSTEQMAANEFPQVRGFLPYSEAHRSESSPSETVGLGVPRPTLRALQFLCVPTIENPTTCGRSPSSAVTPGKLPAACWSAWAERRCFALAASRRACRRSWSARARAG
ncbi:MAG: PAS domain S-box protein [Planctomycetes bacterium]|nr:PAS domain S-box protein [Planctomycetota bacterium]